MKRGTTGRRKIYSADESKERHRIQAREWWRKNARKKEEISDMELEKRLQEFWERVKAVS